jgi:hypothetical protein
MSAAHMRTFLAQTKGLAVFLAADVARLSDVYSLQPFTALNMRVLEKSCKLVYLHARSRLHMQFCMDSIS